MSYDSKYTGAEVEELLDQVPDKLGKTEKAADSEKLGGVAASEYAKSANIPTLALQGKTGQIPRAAGTSIPAGWYRIGVTTRTSQQGWTFRMMLRRHYNNNENETYIIDAAIGYASGAASNVYFTQVAGGDYARKFIDKVRVTATTNSVSYIDLYISADCMNNIEYLLNGDAEAYEEGTIVTEETATTYEFATVNGMSSSGNITAPKFIGALQGNADSATDAKYTKILKGYALANIHNKYIKIGTFTIPQNGYHAALRISIGYGYNAVERQLNHATIYIQTSNGNVSETLGLKANIWAEVNKDWQYYLYVVNDGNTYTIWTSKTNYTGGGCYVIPEIGASGAVAYTHDGGSYDALPDNLITIPIYWDIRRDNSNNINLNGSLTTNTLAVNGNATVNGLIQSVGSNTDVGLRATGSTYNLLFGIGGSNINRGIYDTTNGNWIIYRDATNNVLFPSGYIGIGTTSPTEKLDVGGNVKASKFIGALARPLQDHGTEDTTFTLTPNILHQWGTVSSLTLTLGGEVDGTVNEYTFQFTSGTTATTLSLPSSVKFPSELTIEANKIYQISIVNNLALISSWDA